MSRVFLASLMVVVSMAFVACSTPSRNISNLRLGMTPDEVLDEMGRPYAIRTAKLYRDGSFQEVWEYIPSIFSVALFADRYDKTYFVYFDGGKLVMWGEPGDLTGQTSVEDDAAVLEYVPERRTR